MKVYLSLPISGYDEMERRRYAAMMGAKAMVEHEDWDIINPFHVASRVKKDKIENGDWGEPTYDELMKADLKALLTCDLIAFCPGWHLSEGCLEEWLESLRLGMEHVFLEEVR